MVSQELSQEENFAIAPLQRGDSTKTVLLARNCYCCELPQIVFQVKTEHQKQD
jgi:hypothetical protein